MAAGGSIGGPGAPSGGELAPRIDAAPSTPTPPKPTQRPTRQIEATRIIEARRKKAAEAAIPQSTDLPAQAAEAAATAEAAKGKSPTSVLEGFASGSLPPLPDLIDMADRKMQETGEQYSRERITDEIVRELAENPKFFDDAVKMVGEDALNEQQVLVTAEIGDQLNQPGVARQIALAELLAKKAPIESAEGAIPQTPRTTKGDEAKIESGQDEQSLTSETARQVLDTSDAKTGPAKNVEGANLRKAMREAVKSEGTIRSMEQAMGSAYRLAEARRMAKLLQDAKDAYDTDPTELDRMVDKLGKEAGEQKNERLQQRLTADQESLSELKKQLTSQTAEQKGRNEDPVILAEAKARRERFTVDLTDATRSIAPFVPRVIIDKIKDIAEDPSKYDELEAMIDAEKDRGYAQYGIMGILLMMTYEMAKYSIENSAQGALASAPAA